MSLNKDEYPSLAQGCPPQHVTLDGEANESGQVLDVHVVPNRSTDWDRFYNNDVQLLGRMLFGLQQKVGEPTVVGNAVSYAAPGAVPDYAAGQTAATLSAGVGLNGVTSVVMTAAPMHFSNGTSHHDALIALDRSLRALEARLGLPALDPTAVSQAKIGNFKNCAYFGAVVQGATGPMTGRFPHLFDANDSLTEALAKTTHWCEQLRHNAIPAHSVSYDDPNPSVWLANNALMGDAGPTNELGYRIFSARDTIEHITRLIEDVPGQAPTQPSYTVVAPDAAWQTGSATKASDYEIAPTSSLVPDLKLYKTWSQAKVAYHMNNVWRKANARLQRLEAKLGL